MKRYKFLAVIIAALFVTSCDLLDRPPLNDMVDDATFWSSEINVRLFANEFYPQFFVGYNSSFTVDYTPVRGNVFNDDVVREGPQLFFDNAVPPSLGSSLITPGPAWRLTWAGPTWYFGWIRKANMMKARIETHMSDILNEEQYNHWMAVARFFKALDYCRLVSVFGDVPYFEREISALDVNTMFKDRTPRNEVMDSVYNEFRFVLENLREDDGAFRQRLTRDVAAGFISRWMLFEGTWQKYHNNDEERARKFLEFSVYASEILMNSGRYRIHGPFRELFGSQNLAGHAEMIIFRGYSATVPVMHCIASYSNPFVEAQAHSANLDLVKSFIVHDGDVWQNSTIADADRFDLQNLIRTRDPRFEATFFNQLSVRAASLLYAVKFNDRIGPALTSAELARPENARYISNTNTNDAPVVRFGEILLNWIEAKAELATLGAGSVSQADIDRSINALRARPLDNVAIANGAQLTALMQLSALPDDPARDADVPALIWEIRRERRMELFWELPRLLDLKRWRKIDYMRGRDNENILRGIWVDIPNEIPAMLTIAPSTATTTNHQTRVPNVRVQTELGNPASIVRFTVVFDDNGEVVSSNRDDMVGFFLPINVADREPFTDRVYLSPVGLDQIELYRSRGFRLTQTPGW